MTVESTRASNRKSFVVMGHGRSSGETSRGDMTHSQESLSLDVRNGVKTTVSMDIPGVIVPTSCGSTQTS